MVEVLAQILIEVLTEEQTNQILQVISNGMDDNDGHCPVCDGGEYPINEDGAEYKGDEDEEITGWREEHANDCIVTLIEQNRAKGGKT